jgi:glycerophosphoryl diester phosphodiesterase
MKSRALYFLAAIVIVSGCHSNLSEPPVSGPSTKQTGDKKMVFQEGRIYWQAHRGGGLHEAPDNTLAAVRYGWSFGAIPEVDIQLTADDQVICLHDDTLARTTDAPANIANLPARQLPLKEIKKYDAGRKFDPKYAGEHVPALSEVFEEMRSDRRRMIYADIKTDDAKNFPILLEKFAELVSRYGVASQILVCNCDYSVNMRMREAVPGIHVMLWIGTWGSPDPRKEKLDQFQSLVDKKFVGLDEVQFHLAYNEKGVNGWHYDLSPDDLKKALEVCRQYHVALQVFPFQFTRESLKGLYDLGITHYTTDEPARFKKTIDEIRSEH